MNREDLVGLMRQHLIADCELETVIQFVHDLLHLKAHHISETEPYAVVTLERIKNAASEVWYLLDDIEEAMEDEEDED